MRQRRHIRDRGCPTRDGRDMERFLDYIEDTDCGSADSDEVPAESVPQLVRSQQAGIVSRWS